MTTKINLTNNNRELMLLWAEIRNLEEKIKVNNNKSIQKIQESNILTINQLNDLNKRLENIEKNLKLIGGVLKDGK